MFGLKSGKGQKIKHPKIWPMS